MTDDIDQMLIAALMEDSRRSLKALAQISGLSSPSVAERLRRLDRGVRENALAEAQRLAIEDLAVIPTHFQVNVWATRKGLSLPPRMDESTLAHEIKAQ